MEVVDAVEVVVEGRAMDACLSQELLEDDLVAVMPL